MLNHRFAFLVSCVLLCLIVATGCRQAEAPSPSDDASPPLSASAPQESSAAAAPEPVESIYTELSAPTCTVVEEDGPEDEPPVGRLDCPGPVGYALQVVDFDARMDLFVVDPEGTVHGLEFWRTVTGSFSSLGPRAEWRLAGGKPAALIVRLQAFEDPEDPNRATSYLVVSKISPEAVCVTAKIEPMEEQNVVARAAADRASITDCLAAAG